MELQENTPPVVVPPWLAMADDEERAELHAIGVVDAMPTEEPARAAMASMLMRRLFYIERDIDRHEAAHTRETQALGARYDRIIGPLRVRRMAFAEALLEIARSFPYPGKSKSTRVGWGKIGTRKQTDVVEITDDKHAVDALKLRAPHALKVTISMPYDEAMLAIPRHIVDGAKLEISKSTLKQVLALNSTIEIDGAKLVPGESVPFYEVEGLQEVVDE